MSVDGAMLASAIQFALREFDAEDLPRPVAMTFAPEHYDAIARWAESRLVVRYDPEPPQTRGVLELDGLRLLRGP